MVFVVGGLFGGFLGIFLCECGIWQTVWTEPFPGHSLTYEHDSIMKPGPCKHCLSDCLVVFVLAHTYDFFTKLAVCF